MKNLVILDTHVLLWSVLEPEELDKKIKSEISEAQKNNLLAICSISLWEIAMLNFKKRLNIFGSVKNFLEKITRINGLRIIEITPEIAAESVMLVDNFHGDPADRIIVASTKIKSATLLTRDKKILRWAKAGHIKFSSV
jgi:PIN domain nuclease of toxin-antitoxin system